MFHEITHKVNLIDLLELDSSFNILIYKEQIYSVAELYALIENVGTEELQNRLGNTGVHALLDWFNITSTRTLRRTVKKYLPYLTSEYGNPSSKYYPLAQNAQQAVEESRAKVAALIHAKPEEIIFTCGSTESSNMIIKGVADYKKYYEKLGNHIRPTGGNKQLKYLFSVLTEHISWFEQGASGHPKPEKSNIINYDTITIEHISPQSPSGTSIFTGDDIHKLKNLTLLTPPENDLAANKDYAAKKPIYVNSTYKLNTFFESIDTWNVRASEQWETHLIDMACKIFVV